MSEIRQLLRYEIPGLFIIIYSTISALFFMKTAYIVWFFHWISNSNSAILIGLIALLVGWIIYQIYVECIDPHKLKTSFKLVKRYLEEDDLNLISPQFRHIKIISLSSTEINKYYYVPK